MSVISSSLKSTITFGGVVSQSFTRSTKTLDASLKGTERRTADLTRQQQELVKQIAAGVMAGQSVEKLRNRYARLTEQIRETEREQSRLNLSMRMRGAGAATLKGGLWTGKAALTGGAMGLGGIIAAGSGALALNAHTAEQRGMARSYGVSTNTFRAWDGIGKQMGLSGENLGDLAQELANKVGEIKSLGEQSSVTDGLKMMGLNLSDLKGKSNEDQMATVLNRALKMNDEQSARSAVDMIMGGEANKIAAWMRMSGKKYEELMAVQKRYILTTEDSDEAAAKGQFALSNLWVSVSTAAQSVLGTLAGELAPSITKYADDFSGWFANGGRELLVSRLMTFGSGISDFWTNSLQPVLKSLWRGLEVLARFINKYFADYETEISGAKSEGEVKRRATEQWGELNPDSSMLNADDRQKLDEFVNSEVERWRTSQDDKERARQTAPGTSYSNYDLSGRYESQDSKLISLLEVSSPPRPRAPPLQQSNNLSVTVITQPGADAQQIGDSVGAKV
ncbi:hypothetical protein EXW94_28390, partial [Enterobacter sp. JMULE2]|uniref:hypothetical protein n=1 Tax=Enterobacter sp. JMULE2 TaxID=2518340 RepID=UPI0015776403